MYVNVSKYLKIAGGKRSSRENIRLVSALCTVIPTISTVIDMIYWSAVRLSPSSSLVICHNLMPAMAREVSMWCRMIVSFFLPIIVIIYCNIMIAHTVKKHIRDTGLGKNVYRRATRLPLITVACFVCCWTPWIVSVLYFRFHMQCNMATVLNVCTAIGHLYCLSNPVSYILVNTKPAVHRHRNIRNCTSS